MTKNMRKKVQFLLLVFSLTGCLWHCTQKSASSSAGNSNAAANSAALAKALSTAQAFTDIGTTTRTATVSAFDLDDSQFLVLNVTVGLQTFLNSLTPVLNYQMPANADYVQIQRCPANAVISGTSTSLSLQDISLSSMTSADRDALFSNNDFFTAATNAGCSELTNGSFATTFYDSWAPSGSYRYLVQACVNPQRLTDTTQLSTRNCSRQLAISIPLNNYVNSRQNSITQNLQQANQAESAMFGTLQSAKVQADAYACYVQWCECGATAATQSICQRDKNGVPTQCSGGAYGQAIAVAKKNAIIQLVSTGLDVVMTAATLSFPTGALEAGMSTFAVASAMGGYSFNGMFDALATQTQDFPRACAQGISLNAAMAKYAQQAEAQQAQYNFYACQALAGQSTTSNAAGSTTTSAVSISQCPTSPTPSANSTTGTGTGTGG